MQENIQKMKININANIFNAIHFSDKLSFIIIKDETVKSLECTWL